jgi:hypothetical protein
MKHLKLFESFNDIETICKKYQIEPWTINSDGSIDVNGDVDLSSEALTKLPLKFGKVTGVFRCNSNKLTTLEGCPREVGGVFNCYNNQLTTLEGAPKEVSGSFYCHYNQLTTLEGAPENVGGYFYCNNNQLTTLEGAPENVGGDFYCRNNQLTTLEGGPKEVGGNFYCQGNPIYQVYKLFPNYKSFIDSLDYNYLRGTDIVKSRFKEALDEIGKEMPKKIVGYNYI